MAQGSEEVSSTELAAQMQVSPATINRYLEQLLNIGLVTRTGQARQTRYSLSPKGITTTASEVAIAAERTTATVSPK